jgi:uncharacterized membrane protein YhhN
MMGEINSPVAIYSIVLLMMGDINSPVAIYSIVLLMMVR